MSETIPVEPPWIANPILWASMSVRHKAESLCNHLPLLGLSWDEACNKAVEITNNVMQQGVADQPAEAPASRDYQNHIIAMQEAYDAMLSSWSILIRTDNPDHYQDTINPFQTL